MNALTVWQPWASLIAAGAKPFEWRKWPAPTRLHGERIAIHAGSRKVKPEEIRALLYDLERGDTSLISWMAEPLLRRWLNAPRDLPLSSIICTAVVGPPIRAADLGSSAVADSDRLDHTVWGWPLTQIEAVEPMVPARGAQGLWPWDPSS